MKKRKIIALVLALLCFACVACACKSEPESTDTEKQYNGLPKYNTQALAEYVKPFAYTGITVTVKADEARSEAVWAAVLSEVEIIKYPSEQVEYYAAQERAKYKYYAKRDGIEYGKLLEGLGITEAHIINDAKVMVKKDLALLYILQAEGIAVTDKEKTEHFDKYCEKFVQLYGYDKETVAKTMTEQIYEAMLYDKTSEFLILNNNIESEKQ